VAVVLAIAGILLVITGMLAISDLGDLDGRGPSEAAPSVSAAAAPNEVRGPFVIPGRIPARTEAPVSEPSEALTDQGSLYTCGDREIRDATMSRWQLGTVLAGSRRGFERVTLPLIRRGDANRAARIRIEWMSPQDARSTFGLPRFEGRRGVLLSFGGQVTTTGTQLIGPLDLRSGGIESISGVYRFVDFDGLVRTFIAIRDQACARIRAPGLEDGDDSSRGATILVDLGPP
jgi:hypothetical protein